MFKSMIKTVRFLVFLTFVSNSYAWKWKFWKGCEVNKDLKNFKENIESKIYGQPLATSIVYNSIKNHINNQNPRKALVLSFHGWTGTGKNLLSKLIVEELFPLGEAKTYSHLYLGTRDFKHESKVEDYKDFIQKEIENHVTKCERSVFIFDEIHTIPTGVLNAIQPFVDFHEHINGIDYRKAIFIFLSNTGGEHILNLLYNDFWIKRRSRNEVKLKDIEPLIANGSYFADGGFEKSLLIQNSLINAFVPFFPLERKHVKMCIIHEIKAYNRPWTDAVVNTIVEELEYAPTETQVYSKSGCKRVYDKVALHLL